MKKIMFTALAAVLAAFLVTACSSDSGGGGNAYAPPDMGSAADLPASGGTAPATEAAAKALFVNTVSSMSPSIMTAVTPDDPAGSAISRQIVDQPINFSGELLGGTVSFTGHYYYNDGDMDFAAIIAAMMAKQPFSISNSLKIDISGDLSNLTVTNGATQYTVNGKIYEKLHTTTNTTTTFTADDSITTGTYAYGFVYGYALSVRDSAGVGAKFILSVSASDSGIYDPDNEDMPPPTFNATLKVYDDNNEEIYSVDVSDELAAQSEDI